VTYAEFLAREWESYETHMSQEAGNIPESNYPFKVGEEVVVGNLSECKIEEILMGGRLLHISRHDRGESYGKPWDNQRRVPILRWWLDVEPISPVEETNFRRPRVNTDFIQTSMDSLLYMAYHRGLITSPDYQRDYVWTLEDKQRLIRSIFDRADIGKFVFLERPYPENRLEVVDGKQRLSAIMEFYEGRFAFEGKTYFQLSNDDKSAFTDIMIQMARLNSEYIKKSDVLWLFLCINAGGVPQTEEHVARARKLYEAELAKERKNVQKK
jgi:hypothetical protein